jgi:glutamate racemase
VETVGQAAPLFVPLAEEGWTAGDVPALAARRYLAPLAQAGVDVVVLGCTHYPLLRPVIEHEARALIGQDVAVVDSAHATAADVKAFLTTRGLANEGGGAVQLLATDLPKNFADIAARFLGEATHDVEQVDL